MKTKILVLFAAAAILALAGIPSQKSYAEIRVGIGINLPAYTFAAPPALTVIPGTYAYFAPDAAVDIVFYDGYWYRPYEGRWFRAKGYNGPWKYAKRVPRTIVELPPDYRTVYRGYPTIEYRDHHRNWKRWQKERCWDNDERWREGKRHERHERHDEGKHGRPERY